MAKRARLKSNRVRLTPKATKRIEKKALASKPSARKKESDSSKDNYEVGKYRPPLHTRFKKGDGRKRPGRPKGSKNIATLVLEAANTQIEVTLDGKKRKISKAQAAAIHLANAGATGNEKLLLKFIDLIGDIEARAEAARPSEYPFNDADKTVIRETYKRLRPYEERADD